MDLTPSDLGTERYLAVMRRRLSMLAQSGTAANGNGMAGYVVDDTPLPAKIRRRTRYVRRYWTKDLGLDPDTAEKVGELAWKGGPGVGARVVSIIFGIYWMMGMFAALASQSPVWVLGLLALIVLIVGSAMAAPRPVLRKQHSRVIGKSEIESLLPTARGRLERTYLNLVLDSLRQTIPSESAQADIRAALRDLGDTVSRLPSDAVPATSEETLREQATERRLQAQAEPDSFVRASLLREAEAFDRRAAMGAQSASSARRLSALRHEARTQMDALRAVLIAFEHTSHADATTITHLSETVQHVALEAQAASTARRELEEDEIVTLFGKPIPAAMPVEPVVQTRQPAVAPPTRVVQPTDEPKVQVLQPGRPWWRGQ